MCELSFLFLSFDFGFLFQPNLTYPTYTYIYVYIYSYTNNIGMMNSELEERVFYWINAVRQSDRRTESTCTCLREGAHLLSIHSIGAADFGLYICVCVHTVFFIGARHLVLCWAKFRNEAT